MKAYEITYQAGNPLSCTEAHRFLVCLGTSTVEFVTGTGSGWQAVKNGQPVTSQCVCMALGLRRIDDAMPLIKDLAERLAVIQAQGASQ